MRLGFVLSAFGHAMLVLIGFIALANPRPVERGPTAHAMVDICPESEIAKKETKPPLKFEFPEDKITEKTETQAPKPPSPPEPAAKKSSPEPEGQAAKEPPKPEKAA